MSPREAAQARDRRDRARGPRDDALPRRDLRARLVHVEHRGPLPLPVRHHRGGRDPRQPVRLVHAHADDGVAHARQVRGAVAGRGRRRGLAARVLRRGSTLATRACSAGRWRHRVTWSWRWPSRSRSRRCRSFAASAASSFPPTWTRPSSGVHHGARGHERRRDGRGDAGESRTRSGRSAGVRDVLLTTRRIRRHQVNTASVYVRIAPHEERIFSLGRLLEQHASRTAARRVPGQLLAVRRDDGDRRAARSASPTARARSATSRRSTSAAARGT